jgi:hypothetical protein
VDLLLDNDIVHKLAQLDLLTEASQLLKEEYRELKVLSTFKFKFCPKKEAARSKAEKKYGVLVVERIEAFLKSGITEIEESVEDECLLDAMSSDKDLNIGEMQLLQALLNEKEQLLFTSDKRFLQALSNTEVLQNKLIEIQNSFVCFEQIIHLLTKKISFEKVRNHYIEAKNNSYSVDEALRLCFSSEPAKITETQFLLNLESYINDLQRETNNLLISTPLFINHTTN